MISVVRVHAEEVVTHMFSIYWLGRWGRGRRAAGRPKLLYITTGRYEVCCLNDLKLCTPSMSTHLSRRRMSWPLRTRLAVGRIPAVWRVHRAVSADPSYDCMAMNLQSRIYTTHEKQGVSTWLSRREMRVAHGAGYKRMGHAIGFSRPWHL